jgi:hypothetical protein
MRARVFLSLFAALIVATALASASGATTVKAAKVAHIDVSTRAAVIHYLRSIHVNAKDVVIQRGGHNYAGPSCPGEGWSCTSTAHPVVQVAQAGGKNTFACRTSKCAVVQIAGGGRVAPSSTRRALQLATNTAVTNTAVCIRLLVLNQSCTISQSSASQNNVAVIYQAAVGLLVPTQTASLTASITQRATGLSNTNTACVSQNVVIDGSTISTKPVSVALEAHQKVTITQDSSHGGNSAKSSATPKGACEAGHPLTQLQVLNSIVAGRGSVTQNEDAASNGPNVSLDIEQNQSNGFKGSATGTNSAVFSQTSNLQAVANSPTGPIIQTQSSPDTDLPYSGLVGTVNQDSSGISTASATQTETQCEDAAKGGLTHCDANDPDASEAPASLTQTQYGPEGVWKASSHRRGRVLSVHKGVGTATQTGNNGDTFTINQSSTQNTDQGTGSHQSNVVQGDCSTPGSCTVVQNTNVDGQTHTNTQSGQDVNTTTNCTGSTCTTPEIIFDGSSGTGAPPDTLGDYPMTPFGADPQPSCGAEGSSVTGVSDPAGTIGFDAALQHDSVVNSETETGCWATWSNGYTGDVYFTASSSVTITLPSGTQAFYLYAEPEEFQQFTVQATAQDGTTSGPIEVQGQGGAQFFGFYGTGGATVNSITVSCADPDGFAVGEFGISPAADESQ